MTERGYDYQIACSKDRYKRLHSQLVSKVQHCKTLVLKQLSCKEAQDLLDSIKCNLEAVNKEIDFLKASNTIYTVLHDHDGIIDSATQAIALLQGHVFEVTNANFMLTEGNTLPNSGQQLSVGNVPSSHESGESGSTETWMATSGVGHETSEKKSEVSDSFANFGILLPTPYSASNYSTIGKNQRFEENCHSVASSEVDKEFSSGLAPRKDALPIISRPLLAEKGHMSDVLASVPPDHTGQGKVSSHSLDAKKVDEVSQLPVGYGSYVSFAHRSWNEKEPNDFNNFCVSVEESYQVPGTTERCPRRYELLNLTSPVKCEPEDQERKGDAEALQLALQELQEQDIQDSLQLQKDLGDQEERHRLEVAQLALKLQKERELYAERYQQEAQRKIQVRKSSLLEAFKEREVKRLNEETAHRLGRLQNELNFETRPRSNSSPASTKNVSPSQDIQTIVQNSVRDVFKDSFGQLINVLTNKQIASQPHLENPLQQSFSSNIIFNDRKGTPNTRNSSSNPDLSRPLESEHLVSLLGKSMRLSRAPFPLPTIFGGDPLKYSSWKRAINHLLEQEVSESERLSYLEQYLSESVRNSVKAHFQSDAPNASSSILAELDKRYGDGYALARQYVKDLENWPTVKDTPLALRSFSDQLRQTELMTQDSSLRNFLDEPLFVKSLNDKLPERLCRNWKDKVRSFREDHDGKYPSFSKFVNFVVKKSEGENDPVYGCSKNILSAQSNKSNLRSTFSAGINEKSIECLIQENLDAVQSLAKDVKTLATFRGQEKTGTCAVCNENNHPTGRCFRLKGLSIGLRIDKIMSLNLCFRCLGSRHAAKTCDKQIFCSVCRGRHNTLVHIAESDQLPKSREYVRKFLGPWKEARGTSVQSSGDQDEQPIQDVSTGATSVELHNFQVSKISHSVDNLTTTIVPVYVSSTEKPSTEILCYAMLDTQSDATYITSDVVEESGAEGRPAILRITTVTHNKTKVKCKAFRGLRIRGIFDSKWVSLGEAFSRDSLEINPQRIPTRKTAESLPYLKHLAEEMPQLLDAPVGLLIGYDNSEALRPLKIHDGPAYSPYAVLTHFGWAIVGAHTTCQESFDKIGSTQYPCHTGVCNTLHNFKTEVEEASLNDLIQIMNRDVDDLSEGFVSQNDRRFIDILNSGIHQNHKGHFEMPLPMKENIPLQDNRFMAERRLLSLKRQFSKNPQFKELYTSFVQGMIERGDAEKIPANEVVKKSRWYLPHHGVFHHKKPNKLRVVFDCSARHQGKSLNDYLLQGPDMLNSLVGILCRFRLHEVAFCCDIEKMFHQFHVNEEYRDFLRFLWWENGNMDESPVDYRMRVHIFGAVSSPGCANYALRYIAEKFRNVDCMAASFLERDFYVDDGVESKPTVSEAAHTLSKAIEICGKGKLRLHKIASNSSELLACFPESEVGDGKEKDLGSCPSIGLERTLGIQWNTDTDMLCFSAEEKKKPHTRRGILSTVAALYDPLGFLAPVVLVGKQILRETCLLEMGWDDPIDKVLSIRWENWLADLPRLLDVRIPRCYKPFWFGACSETQLHHFSDASEGGYGFCSYLRLVNENGDVHSSFVMAKSRVAPKRKMTIPRMELQAAVLASKSAKFLEKELDVPSVEHTFWSDSKIVLGYIQNQDKKFHVFVANRIQQIRDSSSPCQWRYVKSIENPADHVSRGLPIEQLLSSNWFTGPSFLRFKDLQSDAEVFSVADTDIEVKQSFAAVTERHSGAESCSMEDYITRLNSLDLVMGVFGLCIHLSRKRKGLVVSELECRQEALVSVVRQIQSLFLLSPPPSLRNSLKQLDAQTDDRGIMVVGGRLKFSKHLSKIKHPIIIPSESHLSVLIARKAHCNVKHLGRSSTLFEIRRLGFHVLSSRKIVGSVIRTCKTCTRSRGVRLNQKMADLPEERTDESPPFSYCGIDCFGPFPVKTGRSSGKKYALMVTCLASRAIHVEVLDDMTTSCFINAFRKVVAIRGNIRKAFCDRGTNFVGAKNEFQAALKNMCGKECTRQLLKYHCEFVFNPPSASHMGGAWERQIRTFRNALFATLGNLRHPLHPSELATVFYEAAAAVNNRPLCVESLETADCLPISPNQLLTMKTEPILPPPGNFSSAEVYTKNRWRVVQQLSNEFWTRWIKEYLSTLQSRRKWQGRERNVKVGDLVWLADEFVHRSAWPLARVEETFPGKDGLVRSVKLRLTNSSLSKKGIPCSQTSFLDRPIHKLVLFIPVEDQ